MAYAYFEKLIAPEKKFFWFEEMGHNNCFVRRNYDRIVTEEIRK